MTSCATALFPSTLVSLTKVESESRQFCAWFPTSLVKLTTELNGSRRSFLCVISNRHTKNVQKFHISFRGSKSAGMCAQSADFHYATQIVHIKFTCIHSILLTNYQLGSRWKWVKTVCVSIVNLTNCRYRITVPNSTHPSRHKFRWGHLDWLH